MPLFVYHRMPPNHGVMTQTFEMWHGRVAFGSCRCRSGLNFQFRSTRMGVVCNVRWNLHEVFIPAPGEQEFNFGHDIVLDNLDLLFLMLLEGVVLVPEDELED